MVPVWVRPWLLAALLAYAVFGFYWYLFVGYAGGWHNQPEQRLATKLVEPVDWDTLETAAAGDDVLLSVTSSGRDGEAEACTRDGACRDKCQADGTVRADDTHPVLNCLVTVPEADMSDRKQQIERMIRQRDPLGLSYLLRATDDELAVVARLQGNIEAMQCGPNGTCYLIAELPDIPNKTVFVSNDHGHHWQLAAQNVLDELEGEGRVVFRYRENLNGSMRDIAGISSANGRVVGLMPHPEHATEALTGPSDDGLGLFYSALDAVLAA